MSIQDKTPKPIDFTNQHKFGYPGSSIKLALKQRIHGLEQSIVTSYELLQEHLVSDDEDIDQLQYLATLIPALYDRTEDSAKVLVIRALAKKINNNQKLLDRLKRASRGIVETTNYVLTDEDLEFFGL